MKFSTTKTIVLEEFPDDVKPWLTKLINPLNQFLEQTYKTLVNGITIRDNVKSQVDEIKIVANQVYPIKVSWKVNEKPTACYLGALQQDTSSFTLLPVHSFQWVYNQGQLEIYFNGLDTTKAYTGRIITMV